MEVDAGVGVIFFFFFNFFVLIVEPQVAERPPGGQLRTGDS